MWKLIFGRTESPEDRNNPVISTYDVTDPNSLKKSILNKISW